MRRLVFSLAALAALSLSASAQEAPVHDAPRGDGIHVIGEWTLTVTDPDGSVVEERAFYNDYVGGNFLPLLLSGFYSTGTWQVRLDGSPSLCTEASGGPSPCVIREEDPSESDGPQYFENLVVSYVLEDGENILRLRGSATAANAGSVTSVATRSRVCDADIAPETCDAAASVGFSDFTYRDLGAETLAVQAGQTVNVQVDISFE